MIPEIAVDPTELNPDTEKTLIIRGSNLDPEAKVSLGIGISVKTVEPVGKTLKVTVSVDKNAEPGPRNLVVRNPDCSTATLSGKISVAAPVVAPAPIAPSAPKPKKSGKPNP